MIYITKNKIKEIKKINNSNAGIEMIKLLKWYEKYDLEFKKFREKEAVKEKNEKERSQRSLRRTRKNIQDILNSNLDDDSYFLTLTFKDDINDYEKAQEKFNYWIRIKNKNIKYLVVKELQTKTRDNVIHYHMIVFDIQPKEMIELMNSWIYGFKTYKHIKNKYSYSIANYLTKYMTKEKNQLVEKNKRVFSKSTNLKKPLIISDEIIDQILKKHNYNVDLRKYDWSQHEYIIKDRKNSNLAVSIK